MSLDTLTNEQRGVLHELLKGHSIALLGAAGCGKSYLLSIIYTDFPRLWKQMHPYSEGTVQIQMCALTGCAALLLGHNAKTVHSWAGIGLGKGTVDELCLKIRKNTRAKRNWVTTDLLIIDEISMMTAELLDKLSEIGKKIRKDERTFGGIQLLFVGDFYQLPPVIKQGDKQSDKQSDNKQSDNKQEDNKQGDKKNNPIFAFESTTWKEGIHSAIELTMIQRQKDPLFQQVLKEARTGVFTEESCALLRNYQDRDWKANKIRPTLLFPRRAEVDMINESNLKALIAAAKPRQSYKARLVYDVKKMIPSFSEKNEQFQRTVAALDAEAAYAIELELVEDAQVMLIANIDPGAGLVNGSRGVIVGFCRATTHPIVEFVNGARRIMGPHNWVIDGYPFVSRAQVPLRLAFSCTIHKAQGASLDCALVDIGPNNFEYGQAYVALSRVRSLDALFVYDFDASAFRVHPRVKAFYKGLIVQKLEEYPMFHQEEIKEEPGAKVEEVPQVEEEPQVDEPCSKPKVDELCSKPKVQEEEPGSKLKDETKEEPTNWLYDSIPNTWLQSLTPQKDQLLKLSTLLSTKEFLPPREHIWSALTATSLTDVKVVILGQDPYPTPGNAHGLAFSVLPDVKLVPASLKNIYKELATDLGVPNNRKTGYLESWANQGILLLNTVLTVEAGAPQSHAKLGWEPITDHLIRTIAAQTERVVFVLWGKSAQVKKNILSLYLDKNKHRVFESAHPSPLSATKGFFGSRPFSSINAWLTEMGREPIDW